MTHRIDFTFHYDPGHGWLEVTQGDLDAIGMGRTDFSRYSYSDGRRYFLEEDCDCGKFIDAYQNRFDHSPHITEVADGAFIRNLPRVW